jgi:hypothetical protein
VKRTIRGRKGAELLRFLCRHLVGLGFFYRRHGAGGDGGRTQFKMYSGTLITFGDTVFYLTAGHILQDVEQVLKSGQYDYEGAILVDTFGQNPTDKHPIPFDLRGAELLHIDNEDVDFGLIPLATNHVRLLAANGVLALSEVNWIHQHGIQFGGHLMLGFPEEFTSSGLSSAVDVTVSPTLLTVREAPIDADDRLTAHPRFKGTVALGPELQSVNGMSGGPIFGFQFEPQMRYWVVALQSRWVRPTRTVYGCPLPVLGAMVAGSAS